MGGKVDEKFLSHNINGDIIGKEFAYCPATSTIGYELMKIYRGIIQEQFVDREDLRTLFG